MKERHQDAIAIIPAYNEADTIHRVVSRTLCFVEQVVVVDDGSTDHTLLSLRELPVTILRHAQNLGKAAALRRGMQYAVAQGATAIITLDGDGQHDPADIPALLAMHRRDPRAIVLAARRRHRHRQAQPRQKNGRRHDGPPQEPPSGVAGVPIRHLPDPSCCSVRSRSALPRRRLLPEVLTRRARPGQASPPPVPAGTVRPAPSPRPRLGQRAGAPLRQGNQWKVGNGDRLGRGRRLHAVGQLAHAFADIQV